MPGLWAKRNGTVSLFAALDVATARSPTTRGRATPAPTSSPSCARSRAYPAGEVHVILDNSSTHKTPDVVAWLARHPRFTFHFTPTSASWTNQVRRGRDPVTPGLRRGSFDSERALTAAIERFSRRWNAGASPFTCVKTADEILVKAVRETQDDPSARPSSHIGYAPECRHPVPGRTTSTEGSDVVVRKIACSCREHHHADI
jgi:hypothetical protein